MISLSPQQDDALKSVVHWFNDPFKQVFYLGGLAGTGKSTLISPLIESLGLNLEQIEIVAPTGMAAKVVRQKLKGWGVDATTSTIHKAIYQPLMSKPERIAEDIRKQEAMLRLSPGNKILIDRIKLLETNFERACQVNDIRFQMNPETNVIGKRLIVVDESSMVGQEIADDLKSLDIPILAIGDPGQLRPVGDNPGLCIGKPDAMLTEIHRQAADNPIILYSHLVRSGKEMDYGDYGALKIVRPGDDHFTCDPDREAQIIVGMNRTRWDITSLLRQMNGFTSSAPQTGEPLIVCKNSKNHTELVNGTLLKSKIDHPELENGRSSLYITATDEDDKTFKLHCTQSILEENLGRAKGHSTASPRETFRSRKEYHHVDFGWVLTCHKAQGSQWSKVIVHDESRAFKEDAINWLYTAATRAADELVVVR